MATPHGSGTWPPPGPNTSQASGTELQMESSGRCCVFKGPKLKLLNDEKLAKGQSQLEHTPGISAVSVSISTTKTARQTSLAAQVYGRSAASCLNLLDRKIKVTISKIDSYNHDIESGINLFNSKMSSNVCNLDKKIQLIIAGKYAHADVVKELHRLRDEKDSHAYNFDKAKNNLKNTFDDAVRKIECLHANKDNCNLQITRLMKAWEAKTGLDVHELDRQIRNLTIRKDQYDQDTNKKITMLTAIKETCAHNLEIVLNAKVLHASNLDKQIKPLMAQKKSMAHDIMRQLELLNALSNSYDLDLQRRLDLFKQQITSYDHDIRRQSEKVDSMKAPFVHDLDSQLKLLDAKSATFHDFRKQQRLLNSKMFSYLSDVGEKVQQLNTSIRSHLKEDFPLLVPCTPTSKEAPY